MENTKYVWWIWCGYTKELRLCVLAKNMTEVRKMAKKN